MKKTFTPRPSNQKGVKISQKNIISILFLILLLALAQEVYAIPFGTTSIQYTFSSTKDESLVFLYPFHLYGAYGVGEDTYIANDFQSFSFNVPPYPSATASITNASVFRWYDGGAGIWTQGVETWAAADATQNTFAVVSAQEWTELAFMGPILLKQAYLSGSGFINIFLDYTITHTLSAGLSDSLYNTVYAYSELDGFFYDHTSGIPWSDQRQQGKIVSFSSMVRDGEEVTFGLTGRFSLPVWIDGSNYDKIDIDSFYPVISTKVEAYSTPVPEPSTMLLLASGLVGLARFRKKFKR